MWSRVGCEESKLQPSTPQSTTSFPHLSAFAALQRPVAATNTAQFHSSDLLRHPFAPSQLMSKQATPADSCNSKNASKSERDVHIARWQQQRHAQHLNVLVSGCVAGAVSRTMTAPLDRLKMLLQVCATVLIYISTLDE